MKYIKRWNKELLMFIKENIILDAIFIIFIPLLSYIWSNFYIIHAEVNRANASVADYFIILKSPYYFYIVNVLLSIMVLSQIIKRDFTINYFVREKSNFKIFIKHCYNSVIIALIFTVYQTVCTIIISLKKTDILINFDKKRSLFHYLNGTTVENLNFIYVVLISVVFSFLAITLINIMYVCIKWLLNSDLISVVTVLLICFTDVFALKGICALCGLDYQQWIPTYDAIKLLIPLGIIILLILVGARLCKFKELLNAK